MKEYQSLCHSRWDCKYHVVFIPKRRKKILYGQIRRHLGKIFHELAAQKESKIVEGHLQQDHVHMCISIPPKYAVAGVDRSNLRQLIDEEIKKKKLKVSEIRAREIKGEQIKEPIIMKTTEYDASKGTEYFIEELAGDKVKKCRR